jgi:phage-related protein
MVHRLGDPPILVIVLNAPDFTTQNQVQRLNNILQSAKNPVSDAITQKNMGRVDNIFGSVVQNVQNMNHEVRERFPSLSHREQEQVISFWEKAAGYFNNVIDWTRGQMHRIVDWICDGIKIVKDCVFKAFDLAGKAIKGAFNWISDLF